ncbi:Arginine and glutamate-rich protein 1-A [Dissostichus eleginoides]|uniref:Arginine and glutamate-rich protein 1-A n=1 Tax=Dissostichus eleginoides TaxID=100907 RepID=A0AAD9BQI3_DISEL|nr:Arginine and glutamate-rich protein 1-A [Dissostichus eleginoides]
MRIMERQLLEELERQRQRQAELMAQKARKEEEKSKRAAAEKLEKVNSSLQCHLQRSTEEKEECERELISMKQQIATLMQLQRPGVNGCAPQNHTGTQSFHSINLNPTHEATKAVCAKMD